MIAVISESLKNFESNEGIQKLTLGIWKFKIDVRDKYWQVWASIDKYCRARSQFANGRRAHLFVSIHFNAAKNRNAEGVEIFYDGSSTIQSRAKLSKLLAHDVLKNILQLTQAENRGVKEREFFVIRKTWMPAILVEGGFLTNANEKNKLRDQRYLSQIALGIARGIEEYYSH